MEIRLVSQANSVEINNKEFPKNSLVVETIDKNIVAVRTLNQNEVVAKADYGNWKNNAGVPYATQAALITALRAALYA